MVDDDVLLPKLLAKSRVLLNMLTKGLLHPINLGKLAAEGIQLRVQSGKRFLHSDGGGGGVRWGVELLRHWQRQLM